MFIQLTYPGEDHSDPDPVPRSSAADCPPVCPGTDLCPLTSPSALAVGSSLLLPHVDLHDLQRLAGPGGGPGGGGRSLHVRLEEDRPARGWRGTLPLRLGRTRHPVWSLGLVDLSQSNILYTVWSINFTEI